MRRTVQTMLWMVATSLAVTPGLTAALTLSHAQESSPDTALLGDAEVISEVTSNSLPGNRLVLGRVLEIRGALMEIDIGNPQPLHIPSKPAQLKGQSFTSGDSIVVILNDHNAIVDYHHRGEESRHQVWYGRLTTPLTVGLDKAIVETEEGIKTFLIATRAKAKLTAMPVGPELWFLTDETGFVVDAQLAGERAVEESAKGNKAQIKGAHHQRSVVFQGITSDGRLNVSEEGREQVVPYRPPLPKLNRLRAEQEVVLLMDDQGYVFEIATPDVPVR